MPKNTLDRFGRKWSSTMHTMPLWHAHRALHAFAAPEDDRQAVAPTDYRFGVARLRDTLASKTGHSFLKHAVSLLPTHQPMACHSFGLVACRSGSVWFNSCDEGLQLTERKVDLSAG